MENYNLPKFKSGSTLYTIQDYSWISEEKNCVSVLFDGKYYYGFDITSEEDLMFYYGMEQLLVPEDELYATIEEAEQKLKEIKTEQKLAEQRIIKSNKEIKNGF